MQVSEEVREVWDLLLEPPHTLTDAQLKGVLGLEGSILQIVCEIWQQFPTRWNAERGRREQKEVLRRKSTGELKDLLAAAMREREAAIAVLNESGELCRPSSPVFVRSENAADAVAVLEEVLGERPEWAA